MQKNPSKRLIETKTDVVCVLDLPADLDTPVSVYMKLGKRARYAFLLESVDQVEKWGRYSFIGADPDVILSGRGTCVTLETDRKKTTFPVDDPLAYIEARLKAEPFKEKVVPGPFQGGYLGYLGYDTVRFVESVPVIHPPRTDAPEWLFMRVTNFVVYDNLLQTLRLVARVPLLEKGNRALRAAKRDAEETVNRLAASLAKPLKKRDTDLKKPRRATLFSPETTAKTYMKRVLRAKEYIRAGDIFQVVLSMEFRARGAYDPLSLYRVLRTVNPSPYLYLLKLDDFSIVGSSPEIMVRKTGEQAILRPIAGTRRRGLNEKEDAALEADLVSDPKENAEHVMLVDLGRNDLGRVSCPGTVTVSDYGRVERYSHVMHLVSQVEGVLKKTVNAISLFRATFPAGTLSGAPKVRAMEIIEELESTRRGIYGGAVGYIGFDGNMDMAIAIRTLIVHANELVLRAGAGIVQDSVPKNEHDECLNKARALMRVCERLKEIGEASA